MIMRPRRGVHILAGLAGVLLAVQVGSALATFGSTAIVGGNAFTTGIWSGSVFYLHNRPSPPTTNTTSQVNLPMDLIVPTGLTLYRYSSEIANDKGRVIQRSALGLAETDARKYVNWRSPVFTTGKTISGNVILGLWSQPLDVQGTDATITIYLRDFNPAVGSYAEVASLTYRNSSWAPQKKFAEETIEIPVTAYSLAAGHVLELRIVAPASGAADVVLAYDVTTYGSAVQLP